MSAERLDRLCRSLRQRLDDPTVAITPYREGVDCWVDLVTRAGQPQTVVRSAKVELLQTSYEGLVDFRNGLEKEIVVSRLLRSAGLPTPEILAWHRSAEPSAEPSWALLEYVPHRMMEEVPSRAQVDLGRLVRRIHRIEPRGRDRDLLAGYEHWETWIIKRIEQRIDAARRYVELPPQETTRRALELAISDREAAAVALLHLDLRGPNLALTENSVEAIFDLANAIVGDPYLELARLRGCGLLSRPFLTGYGEDEQIVRRNDLLLAAYELDLAALLVAVSREEIDDPSLHAAMAARTEKLLSSLIAAFPSQARRRSSPI